MRVEDIIKHLRSEPHTRVSFSIEETSVGRFQVAQPSPCKDLKSVIEKGEADFAAGRGKTFTVEELEALMHEPA